MLKPIGPHCSHPYLLSIMLVTPLFALTVAGVKAQSVAQSNSADGHSLPREASERTKRALDTAPT